MCCGKSDFLSESNEVFYDCIRREAPSIEISYERFDGVHDWNFWDMHILTVLKKFGLT
jgi:enterochelin esterase-like enzyme